MGSVMTCFCKGVGIFRAMAMAKVTTSLEHNKEKLGEIEDEGTVASKGILALDAAVEDLPVSKEMVLDAYEMGLRDGVKVALERTMSDLKEVDEFLLSEEGLALVREQAEAAGYLDDDEDDQDKCSVH